MGKPPDEPTERYKTAQYGLKCGDRTFAEQFAREQPHRARAVREYLDIINELGWLTMAAQKALGRETERRLPEFPVAQHGRLDLAKEKLHEAEVRGLRLWSLVTIIGEEEGVADPRDPSFRVLVAAEIDEYVDRGLLAREGDRIYLLEFAPAPLAANGTTGG